MKTKYILTLLIATASITHANLIDLTPGGFQADNAPPAFYQFLQHETQGWFTFFDEARVIAPYHGWVSQYGILNGGTYFNTDLFSLDPTPTANVSWNFTTLPGYSMSVLLLFGRAPDGTDWNNLYSVPFGYRFTDSDFVTLNGIVDIQSIAFYGRWPGSPVPEGDWTFWLFLIGLAIIGLYHTTMSVLTRNTVIRDLARLCHIACIEPCYCIARKPRSQSGGFNPWN